MSHRGTLQQILAKNQPTAASRRLVPNDLPYIYDGAVLQQACALGIQEKFFRWLYWQDPVWKEACDLVIDDVLRRSGGPPMEGVYTRQVYVTRLRGQVVMLDLPLLAEAFTTMFQERWRSCTRKEIATYLRESGRTAEFAPPHPNGPRPHRRGKRNGSAKLKRSG